MSIFQFTDPIDFLKNYYQIRKRNDESFGYVKWAGELKIRVQNLKEIMGHKKKMQVRHADLFASHLNLNAEEARYFKLMIKKKNSQNQSDRNFYGELMSDLSADQKGLHEQVLVADGKILGDWVALTLIDLINIPGFHLTIENVHKSLVEDVPQVEIEKSLKNLIDLGLISKNPDGSYLGLKKEIVSKANIQKEAVHKLYRKVADLSKEALKGEFEQRYFQCFTIPVSAKKLESLKKMILALRREMIAVSDFEGDNVYQVNLQMFPLTQIAPVANQPKELEHQI